MISVNSGAIFPPFSIILDDELDRSAANFRSALLEVEFDPM